MSAIVYRTYDRNGLLLYVGCTVQQIEMRLRGHANNSPWWPFYDHVETVEFPTHREALAAEAEAIAAEHPRWNVRDRSLDHPDGVILHDRLIAPWLAEEVAIWREGNRIEMLRRSPPPPPPDLDRRAVALAARIERVLSNRALARTG